MSSNHQATGGFSALHVAILMNNGHQVKQLLASREHAVDGRILDGTTPLMLAGLFGRANIFLFLLRKGASLQKLDSNGCTVTDYVKHIPSTKKILNQSQALTGQCPSKSGRKIIYNMIQAILRFAKQEKLKGHNVNITLVDQAAIKGRTVFLNSGKAFEICQVQRLAYAEFEVDIGSKVNCP